MKITKVRTRKRKAQKRLKITKEPPPPAAVIQIPFALLPLLKVPGELLDPLPVKRGEKRSRTKGHVKAGRWVVNQLAKENPFVAKIQHGLSLLPREDLEDRLGLIVCEILGLTGAETI